MNRDTELILNVNDTEPNRYVTTRILSRAGFRVLEAVNGTEALEIARSERPALIVLDVNLPDMSGIEVCRRLKADPETASIMVLQMSATNIALLDRVESLGAGADSFLVEPVEPEELEAVSRALLRLYSSDAALRRNLAERELLLKEVNHRVKNSLQLVLSMLSLQSHELSDPSAREVFDNAIGRITAIAAVHERLYQADDPLHVEMNSYLAKLLAELSRIGCDGDRECVIEQRVEIVRLPTEQAVSLALIVSELVMNSLKHGRQSNGKSVIRVELNRAPDDQLCLRVADNGPGAPASDDKRTGLGTRLVQVLVEQLQGRWTGHSEPMGYTAEVVFPMPAG